MDEYGAGGGQFWWSSDVEDDERHRLLWREVVTLEEEQFAIREDQFRSAWLYDQARLQGIDHHWWDTPYIDGSVVTTNVVRSVIDTAVAMIAKHRPRAVFLTDGADWDVKLRAELLEMFVEAEFKRSNVYELAVKMFRDACVAGLGALKVYIDRKRDRVCVEHVIFDEIVVDEEACRNAEPRTLYQRKVVDKAVLLAQFPDAAEAIERSATSDRQYLTYRHLERNQVVVIEGFHLPSAPDAGDGRHTICVEHGVLFDGTWDDEEFDFIFYRWTPKLTGFVGRSLARELAGHQLRLNKLNRSIAKQQDTIAVPRIFVTQADAKLKETLTNGIAVYVYRGPQPPKFETPPAVAAEVYAHRRELIAEAFQFAGVSEMRAQATKPSGLDSAVALREFDDQTTQRFAIQEQTYEAVFVRLAKLLVKLYKRLLRSGGKPSTVWHSRDLAKRIQWQDVDPGEDLYDTTVDTASTLSRTPAGRKQDVIELLQSGLINQDQGLMLLDHPDLEAEVSLTTAAADDIRRTIGELRHGRFEPPAPEQDLVSGIKMVTFALLKAKGEGAPEDVLDGFRQWIAQAKHELDRASAAAAPAAAGPSPVGVSNQVGPASVGAPMAPPGAPAAPPMAA